MKAVVIVASFLVLAACETVPAPAVRELDPCTASALAAIEERPVRPALTAAQQEAYDVAVLRALGVPLGTALIAFQDVELPSWSNRQVERVRAQKAWCEARVTDPTE